MSCPNEKTVEPYVVILASYVDWNVLDDPTSSGTYYTELRTQMSALNTGHADFQTKKGRLKKAYFDLTNEKCQDKKEILYFLVSIDAKGNQLLGANNYVARPCPPFCEDGGIDVMIRLKFIVTMIGNIENPFFKTNN